MDKVRDEVRDEITRVGRSCFRPPGNGPVTADLLGFSEANLVPNLVPNLVDLPNLHNVDIDLNLNRK